MMVSMEQDEEGLCRTVNAEVNLTFRVVGAGGVPVVLLHGTSANHGVWEPIAEVLGKRTTVVSVDQRGHGRSDKPATGYDGASFADDIMTVLDGLGIEKAVLAGHSLGARNAWVAGARHPRRVAAVVAVDYVPYVESCVLDKLQTRVADGNQIFSNISDIENYLSERYPRMPTEAILRRAKWGYRRIADGLIPLASADALDQVVGGLRVPWEKAFQDVRMPMICMRGADSAIVSPAAWQTAKHARPDARWSIVEDVDHYVPEENPAVVTDTISVLLDTF